MDVCLCSVTRQPVGHLVLISTDTVTKELIVVNVLVTSMTVPTRLWSIFDGPVTMFDSIGKIVFNLDVSLICVVHEYSFYYRKC